MVLCNFLFFDGCAMAGHELRNYYVIHSIAGRLGGQGIRRKSLRKDFGRHTQPRSGYGVCYWNFILYLFFHIIASRMGLTILSTRQILAYL
jgi:hypothetical protein